MVTGHILLYNHEDYRHICAIDYVWADENQCLTRNIVKKQFICDGLTSFDTPYEWAQTGIGNGMIGISF